MVLDTIRIKCYSDVLILMKQSEVWSDIFHKCTHNVFTYHRISRYSLLKALIELRGPAVVLGLGGKFPLFVTEVRADDVDLDEGPEALSLPLQVVSSHH